jgi:hypothetical protein
VSAISGLATLVTSLRIIKTFLKDVFLFVNKLFYTKKKFIRDAAGLAEDIKIFLQKKQMEVPIINMATDEGFAENLLENERLRQSIRLQFFSDFRVALGNIDSKAHKYGFQFPSIEKALIDPPNSNPALIRNELSDIISAKASRAKAQN